MRLIDADELIYLRFDGTELEFVPKEFIDNAETIEIVRCKECIFWKPKVRINCNWLVEQTTENDFCCWGRRKI